MKNPTVDDRGFSSQDSPRQSYEVTCKPERPCQGLQAQCSCGRHLFQFAKIPEKVSEYEGGPPRWPRSYCEACGKQTRYNLLQCTSCSHLLRDCVLQRHRDKTCHKCGVVVSEWKVTRKRFGQDPPGIYCMDCYFKAHRFGAD